MLLEMNIQSKLNMEILVRNIEKWDYGDIILINWQGEADPEVVKRSKGRTYNVKLTINFNAPDKEEDKEVEDDRVSKN